MRRVKLEQHERPPARRRAVHRHTHRRARRLAHAHVSAQDGIGRADVALDPAELEREARAARLGEGLLERPHPEEAAPRGALGRRRRELGALARG